ncbi:MAG: MmcQ/YjbR family DNA-binding protein [Myxococcota bacterium]
MSARLKKLWNTVRDRALELPEAWEDHPWGESAIKVKKKIFVMLGPEDASPLKLTFKLPASRDEVLRRDDAEPTGYGLGRSGWVTLALSAKTAPSADDLIDWLEESYQAVAPKKFGRLLDPDDDG